MVSWYPVAAKVLSLQPKTDGLLVEPLELRRALAEQGGSDNSERSESDLGSAIESEEESDDAAAGTKAARTRCGADKLLYSDLYYV